MDIEQLAGLGWREGLLAIVALLVLYIILLFVRLHRLQRDLQASARGGKAVLVAEAVSAPLAGEPAGADGTLPGAGSARDQSVADPGAVPLVAPAGIVPVISTEAAPAKPDFAWNEPPPEIPGQALIDALQRDVYALRSEVGGLRSELLAAREDIRRALAQTAGPLPAASPLYKDAMQLAMQGHDAATIARHCAIARAEADLIVALARNRNDGFV